MIQTYGNGTSFLVQTKDGPGFGGDTEINGIPPLFLSGRAGDTLTRNGLGLLAAPFTFTGTLFVYPTHAALAAGGPAARQYELRGVGTADAMLTLSTAGETSGRDPIVSFSAVYGFDEDPVATPEPGTLLLFGAGAAALTARRRSQTRR